MPDRDILDICFLMIIRITDPLAREYIQSRRFWQVTSLQQLADAGIILRVVSAAVNNSVKDHKDILLS